eukprot:gene9342-1682_t
MAVRLLQASAAAAARHADPEAVYVVAGAARGVEDPRCVLLPHAGLPSAELSDLMKSCDRLKFAGDVDMCSSESLQRFATTVPRVDVLFNTVGILHSPNYEDRPGGPVPPERIRQSGHVAPATAVNCFDPRKLDHLTEEWLQHSLLINAVGPLMLLRCLAPALKTTGTKRPSSAAATLSARVGSISDNGHCNGCRMGGWYSYRISKAALNQGLRTASLELRRQGTRVLALHPGTVQTDLSAPFAKGIRVPIGPLVSAPTMVLCKLRLAFRCWEYGTRDSMYNKWLYPATYSQIGSTLNAGYLTYLMPVETWNSVPEIGGMIRMSSGITRESLFLATPAPLETLEPPHPTPSLSLEISLPLSRSLSLNSSCKLQSVSDSSVPLLLLFLQQPRQPSHPRQRPRCHLPVGQPV